MKIAKCLSVFILHIISHLLYLPLGLLLVKDYYTELVRACAFNLVTIRSVEKIHTQRV